MSIFNGCVTVVVVLETTAVVDGSRSSVFVVRSALSSACEVFDLPVISDALAPDSGVAFSGFSTELSFTGLPTILSLLFFASSRLGACLLSLLV